MTLALLAVGLIAAALRRAAPGDSLAVLGRRLPCEAVAHVEGGPLAPGIKGVVEFRRFGRGSPAGTWTASRAT